MWVLLASWFVGTALVVVRVSLSLETRIVRLSPPTVLSSAPLTLRDGGNVSNTTNSSEGALNSSHLAAAVGRNETWGNDTEELRLLLEEEWKKRRRLYRRRIQWKASGVKGGAQSASKDDQPSSHLQRKPALLVVVCPKGDVTGALCLATAQSVRVSGGWSGDVVATAALTEPITELQNQDVTACGRRQFASALLGSDAEALWGMQFLP